MHSKNVGEKERKNTFFRPDGRRILFGRRPLNGRQHLIAWHAAAVLLQFIGNLTFWRDVAIFYKFKFIVEKCLKMI